MSGARPSAPARPDRAIVTALLDAGLIRDAAATRFTALSGGVSSDIWKVESEGRAFCVKRALGRLKVAADWRAPIERNRHEVAWCRRAGELVPGAVPEILHHDETAMLAAMSYLEPATHRLWKEELRDGRASPTDAAAVGRTLAAIHAGATADEALAALFPHRDIFHAIRLEPYLEASAVRHPDLAPALLALSRRTAATRLAMIHGDVSPKNILIGPDGPVFLDAECACVGDPAFDLAFCLNHLLLKCLWRPDVRERFLGCFAALRTAYLAGVTWEPPEALEGRAASLLPGLLLARVDGKSPVEYVTEESDRERVRDVARTLLRTAPARLGDVADGWRERLERDAEAASPTGDASRAAVSCAALNSVPDAVRYRRAPATVMRLARLGAFHPTRLSFLRSLLRQLERERWRFERAVWDVDDAGVGHAVYTVHGPERAYSLVCFAHDLPPGERSDRVIATAWDATFALFDGIPETADIERLRANVPYQEAGRLSTRELTLSRANRSVRLFEHVVERLAAGAQPDPEPLESTAYLMRTTAVYGSGKFGAADRSRIASRPELRGPFRAEMLTVWLIRAFTLDLVEHLARARGGACAVRLAPQLRRLLGVGNATGLGMAPFLVNHPVLLNNWIMAREEALARVRAVPRSTPATRAAFRAALDAARENARLWHSEHPLQRERLATLRDDLATLAGIVAPGAPGASGAGSPTTNDRHARGAFERADAARTPSTDGASHRPPGDDPLDGDHPWDALWRRAERTFSHEGQEALVSLLLEPHGELVDGLADCMDADEDAAFRIDGAMRPDALATLVAERYGWALDVDYTATAHCARFWYVSEDKLEPRLGERHEEDGAEREQPLAIGRDVAALAADLARWRGAATLADFLSAHPEHRHAVRRVQIGARHPFAEIHDNLIGATMLPIDLLRCKLSFFGASRFDPRSDRWVRICLFRDAPHPDELLRTAS